MRTRVVSATCAAIVMGMALAVQAQAPSGSQPPSSSQAAAAKSITVTGCLQRAQPAPTGTSGAAAAAMQPKFVLTSIATSPSGTAGTAGSPTTVSEYRLDFDEAKLTPHVGHKVEITGTVEQPRAGAAPSPSAPPAAASSASAPTLKVENVKMLAATCP